MSSVWPWVWSSPLGPGGFTAVRSVLLSQNLIRRSEVVPREPFLGAAELSQLRSVNQSRREGRSWPMW